MSPEEIVELWNRLRSEGAWQKERMRQVATVVDGDLVIPLPELGVVEAPAVANQAHRGLQAMSQALSSVQPKTKFGPLRSSAKAADEAQLRMRVADYWDQKDRMALLDAQRGRYLFGYGTTPSRVDVNFAERRPILTLPSPLMSYAPAPSQANDITPPFGIAAMQMSSAAVLKRYGGNALVLWQLRNHLPDEQVWVLEYADDVEVHLVLAGKVTVLDGGRGAIWERNTDPENGVTLHRYENRAMICPWVVPGLVHLNKLQGHFDQIIGMYQAQALLTGIELQHAARSVFQETWLVGRPGEVPQVVVPADPIAGDIGEIRGADLRTVAPDPQFHTHMVQDRLQEAASMTAGLPSDVMGQSSSNVRTGRRAAQLIAASVDPNLQEAQTIMAEAKQEEKRRQIAFDKAFCNETKTIYVTWRGKQTESTYTPEDLWTTDESLVSYPVAGTDTNSLAILVGQVLGMGLGSKAWARELLPWFDDPEEMEAQVVAEQLEQVFVEKLAEMVGSPESPLQPRHIARLIMLISERGLTPMAAFAQVEEEAREEQSTEVDPVTEPMAAVPGLDGPGAIPPPVAAPQQGTQNLAALMGRLRMPEMAVNTTAGGRA